MSKVFICVLSGTLFAVFSFWMTGTFLKVLQKLSDFIKEGGTARQVLITGISAIASASALFILVQVSIAFFLVALE